MHNQSNIRCVIVDDEPLAVALIADYVTKTPGLDVVLRTTHVMEALHFVQQGGADLLFLDIQMPELTGLQFMTIIRNACKVILTTAYTQYALNGYEHDVVDYLLKPITLDRFLIAVEKAKQRLGKSTAAASGSATAPTHLYVKTEYRIQRIAISDILYIEALRDYIAIHTIGDNHGGNNGRSGKDSHGGSNGRNVKDSHGGSNGQGGRDHDSSGEKIMSLDSMKNMESTLPPQFLRIHKSYIVNCDRIGFLERGRIVIGSQYLPIGDTYRDKVNKKLGIT